MNVRSPGPADLADVLELLRAADAEVAGDSDWTASDLDDEWRQLDLSRDAWIVELEGRIAGYASFQARAGRLGADGYVHPELRRRGVGSELVRLTEARAAEEVAAIAAGERVYLQNATLNRDDCTVRFYRERGYEAVRGFRGMVIELDEPPDVPRLAGVEIRSYDHAAEGPAFHVAHEESFASHWEHRPATWEEWQERRFGSRAFDPTLWWSAVAKGEIVGVVLAAQKRDPNQGWIDVLGVVPAHRRRGIAEALLKTAFAELVRRGERVIGLGVDAESPTGATRVYERAGMRTLWQAVVYEKELRSA